MRGIDGKGSPPRLWQWSKAGIFTRVLNSLSDQFNLVIVQMGGTYIEAHQHTASAPEAAASRRAQGNPGHRVQRGRANDEHRGHVRSGCRPN